MPNIANKIILILAVVCIHTNSWGQDKYVVMGDKAYENKQFIPAAKYYSKSLGNFEGDITERNLLTYKLASCYTLTNNPQRAEVYYERLVKNNYAKEKPEVYLNYATALNNQGKYAEALPIWDLYLAKKPKDALALAGKACSELGIKNTFIDPRYEINSIKEINSTDDDFAAVSADHTYGTLFFSSNRKGTTGKEIDNWTDGYFSDLFTTTKKKDGTWGFPVLIDNQERINTEANEGAAGFDKNYTRLYFTRCAKIDRGTEYCNILKSNRAGNGWDPPEIIYTDARGNAGQPTVTSDELTLIFASNRPGGEGGKDLWKITRTSADKPFGVPRNLGRMINTPGDEMFPTLFADTVLYFASNGKPGFGGLDIYRVVIGKNGFSDVEHLPQPINSYTDDFAISFTGDERHGFFTSRRDGGRGGDDIYAFEKIPPVITIQGLVTDETTLQPLKNLAFLLIENNKDTLTFKTSDSGSFIISGGAIKERTKYSLVFAKDNYFSEKHDVITVRHEYNATYQVNVSLLPIPEKPIVLADIFYELDKWDLLPQYQDSLMGLVKILNDNPDIVIELASHTDSRATDKYNEELSQKRAEAVVGFLTQMGINPDRLIAKGYGERIPRTLSTDMYSDGYLFESGTILTEKYILAITDLQKREAAYQLNRRTEFIVIRKNRK